MSSSPDIADHPARVLIVDDERQNRQLLEVMLAPEGYLLLTAASGEEALAIVAQQPPDLILLDIMMPGMDGYQVAAKLKADIATRNIPVIIVTAHDDRNARMLGLSAGAEDYLTRPVDRAELCLRVKNLLRLKAYGDYHDKYSQMLEGEVGSRALDLVERESLYRSTFDAAPVGIVHVGLDGQWLRVNQRLCDLLGYSREELQSRAAQGLLELEEAPGEAESLRQMAAGTLDRYVVDERRYRRRDGRTMWARVSMSVYRDAEGQSRHFISVIEDITERKLAEDKIRDLSKFPSENPNPILRIARDGTLLYINEAGLIQLPQWHLEVGHASPAILREAVSQSVDNGSTQLLDLEHGELVYSFVVAPIVAGRYANLYGRDITERKRLEAQRERMAAIVEASPDFIGFADSKTTLIQYINKCGRRMCGLGEDEDIGNLKISDVHPAWMNKRLAEVILPAAARDGSWEGEGAFLHRDGREIPVSMALLARKAANGEVDIFYTVSRDITEKKRLEAQFLQAQKMEIVGQLASGIAHDFNNLLTVINGTAELVLAQVSPDDPVHADVEEIFHAGERAAVLTRQLLAFSRRQILAPRVLNFNTAVPGMEGLLRRLLGEDIGLVFAPAPGLGNVEADPGQIEQVIVNLAVNARDAMPAGGKLTIETQNIEIDDDYTRRHGVAVAPGPYVLLVVSDSGVGMDEATRTRIFEPFFTTKGPGKGTGLGLSTVYGIVKQSHGFVWVESEIGQGTSFKVCLPQVTEAVSTDHPEPTVVSSSGTETILLVEDNAGLRKLATRLLEPAGYTVLGAASGEDALRVLEHYGEPVHLLLSDVVLPGMSGRQFAEQSARTHPGMKVLYMSGYTSDTVVRHGVLEAKMAFLNKPFTAAGLLRKVREVLDA